MFKTWFVGLALLAVAWLGFPASAQEGRLTSGRGIVCDTAEQVIRVIKASSTHEASDAELEKINAESPSACGVLGVLFVKGQELDRLADPTGDRFVVVEIIVVAVVTPNGAAVRVPPKVQYTAFHVAAEERGA
jgi:hypothetical protein